MDRIEDGGSGGLEPTQSAHAPIGSSTSPPALLPEADNLRRSLARVARRLRTLRAEHGISASKLSVLGRLHRAGASLTAVDLARQERLQPQSLTRIIAELDQRGLVARRPDAADRRQVLIDITPQGRELLVLDARQQNAWLAAAMDTKLTGTEQALLVLAGKLLDRLAEEG
jgi:DNA-binding MarR family transcriptional regulator